MMACDVRAVLLVTRQIEGTSTNVAQQRIQLYCSLPLDHDGPHRDEARAEEWVVVVGRASLVVRDEGEGENDANDDQDEGQNEVDEEHER